MFLYQPLNSSVSSGMQMCWRRLMGTKVGENSRFSTSTWIWLWSWIVLMGFAAQFHTLLTQQYSEVTPLHLTILPPLLSYGKHFHSHLWMKSVCSSRQQRLKVWFLLYCGTNSSLELFGTTHNLSLCCFLCCTTTLKGFVGRLERRLSTWRQDDVTWGWNEIW